MTSDHGTRRPLRFDPVAATLAEGEGYALPIIDYCMHAFATTTAAIPELRWAGTPPTLESDQILLVLGPAMRDCAFLGGASGPRVSSVEGRGLDTVVHVGFPDDSRLTWSTARVPRPSPGGQLLVVVHGAIMGPPRDWNEAREHVLPIHPPKVASPSTSPPASSTAGSASPTPTVYVDWHTTQTIAGLEVHVLSLEVKQDTDGHEVLVGALRLRVGGQEMHVTFQGPAAHSWNGYWVEVRGGSKQSVGIAVSRAELTILRGQSVVLPGGMTLRFSGHSHKDVTPEMGPSPLLIGGSLTKAGAGAKEFWVGVQVEQSKRFTIQGEEFELLEYDYDRSMRLRYLGHAR